MDFWQVHGWWFIFFLALFPRITLLFGSVVSGGFLWWLGWLVAPRLLIAFLATLGFWDTNPTLVVCAWVFALCGESTEKSAATPRTSK